MKNEQNAEIKVYPVNFDYKDQYYELKNEIVKLKEKYKKLFINEIVHHNKEIAELQKLFNEEHQRFLKYLDETLCLRVENDDLKEKIRELELENNL